MKFIIKISLIIFVFTVLLINNVNAQEAFMGGEIKVETLNSLDNKNIKVSIIYYYSCEDVDANDLTFMNTAILNLSGCCFDQTYTLNLESDVVNTPICINGVDRTKCINTAESDLGYRKRVYSGNITLPLSCTDWQMGHLIANTANRETLLINGDIDAMIGANPPLGARTDFLTRFARNIEMNNSKNRAVYLYKSYNNSIIDIVDASSKIANNSPTFLKSEHVTHCLGKTNTYDLGLYDKDGDNLKVSFTTPFVDVSVDKIANTLTGVGEKLTWASDFSETKPLGPNTFVSINDTGKLSIAGEDLIGEYLIGLKIEEFDQFNNFKDVTYKEITVTVLDLPSCKFSNSLTNSTVFSDDIEVIANGQSNNITSEVSTCPGLELKFKVKAIGSSPISGASPTVVVKFDGRITDAIAVPSLSLNNYPIADTGYSTITWDVPINTPPGVYTLEFKINECINSYTLSETKIVKIRVNGNTNAKVFYNNGTPEEITLETKSFGFCQGSYQPLLKADNGYLGTMYTWTTFPAGCEVGGFAVTDEGNYFQVDQVLSNCNFVVTSNQYCNNKDTIVANYAPGYNLSVSDSLFFTSKPIGYNKDTTCYFDTTRIIIKGTQPNSIIDWRKDFNGFNCFLNNETDGSANPLYINCKPSVNLNFFVINPTNNCIYPMFYSKEIDGARPYINAYSLQEDAFPLDTVNLYTNYFVPVCGKDIYNNYLPVTIYQEDTFSKSVGSHVFPKIFGVNNNVKYMKTQFLYKASELKALGFSKGKVKKLSFFLQSFSNPNQLNNVKIKYACINDQNYLEDLSSLEFFNYKNLTTIFGKNPNTILLTSGKMDFTLEEDFAWDESTDLLFEVTAECARSTSAIDPKNSPLFIENQTPYISIIGDYIGNNKDNWDQSTVATIGLDIRPKIAWEVEVLDTSNVRLKWYENNISDPTTNMFEKNPNTGVAIKTDTSNIPSVSMPSKTKYYVKASNGLCYRYDDVIASYNDSFNVDIARYVDNYDISGNYINTTKEKVDTINKCNNDTIALTSIVSKFINTPYIYNCNISQKSCGDLKINNLLVDTITIDVFNNVSVLNALVSPFGGVTNTLGNPTSDKKLQFIYTKETIKNYNRKIGMTKEDSATFENGFINGIYFDITKSANTENLNNFSIYMKCTNKDSFDNDTFDLLNSFNLVYYNNSLSTTSGSNYFPFVKPYEWDGESNIMFNICFDNSTSNNYNADQVKSIVPTNKPNVTLYKSVATNANAAIPDYGCFFKTGTQTSSYPDIKFEFCKKYRIKPVPITYNWAPFLEISNSAIQEPFIYNSSDRNYYTYVSYYDTTAGKFDFIGTVADTLVSYIVKPKAIKSPDTSYICIDDSASLFVKGDTIPISTLSYKESIYWPIKDSMWYNNNSQFKIKWTPNQEGFGNNYYDNLQAIVSPKSSKYFYFKLISRIDSNCWVDDSIYVSVQNKSITPPHVFGLSSICQGDSVSISIPTNLNYFNPIWYNSKNERLNIDPVYSLVIKDSGSYYVKVDSGYCNNSSAIKTILLRIPDTISYNITNTTICEGDSILLISKSNNNLLNPIWNTGIANQSFYASTAGVYFLVNPIDHFGCKSINSDSVNITILDNPDFDIPNDTICETGTLYKSFTPNPLDLQANYNWIEFNIDTNIYSINKAGTYRVKRTKNGCVKIAEFNIVSDTIGTIDLGSAQAICCDEIITLDANPNRLNYINYEWNTSENSSTILTKINESGQYNVKATKASGCIDSGTIAINNLCTKLLTNHLKDTITLGEKNTLTAINENVIGDIAYKWFSFEEFNNREIYNKDKNIAEVVPYDTGDVEYILNLTSTDKSIDPIKTCNENGIVRFRVIGNELSFANTFSPNGDDLNEEFYPKFDGGVIVKQFKIYNRFGQLIHDSPLNPWDGNFENEPQPTGVYIAQIEYEKFFPKEGKIIKKIQINLKLIR